MQLRKPESFGVFDHHHRGVGHIHAHLDHGGRNQHIRIAAPEGFQYLILIRRLHAPVYQFNAQIGKIARAQILVHLLGRTRVHGLGFLHQRTHHVHLPPLAHLGSQKAVHARALVLRHDARAHRLASRRQFIQNRYIQIAVQNQRKRSRNRRGGHHQHVDRFALLPQQRALAHAEAMLFIRHGKPQPMIVYALGNQRMRADRHIPFAVLDRLMRDFMLLRGQAAGQQPHFQAQRREDRLCSFIMLARQHFGGRHQRRLIARAAAHVDRAERYRRFAAAHIALHHARHRAIARQIAANLLQHAPLRAGGRKRKMIDKFRKRRRAGIDAQSAPARFAQKRHAQLIQKQLFKRDARSGGFQRFGADRKMRVAHGEIALAQTVFAAQRLRKLIRPLPVLRLKRSFDALANHLLRNALYRAIHRHDARFLFERRAGQLQRSAARFALAVQ